MWSKTKIKAMGGLTNALSFFIPRSLITMAALSIALYGDAQLCNGSLGDPVVNITFDPGATGSGGAPSNSYIYTNSTCPDDGYYTITKSTTGCFGDHWHTVTSDHTGNGSFMLVNASYEPSDFFVTTVTGLCPNTTYQFSAWLMNVLSTFGIKPNITFSIETEAGDTLAKYVTGDIPETSSPTWKEYGFYFTTLPDNAVIVLRMRNNAPGGNGNDIALDDITFSPCGPNINAIIQGNADTVNICEDNRSLYTFNGTVSSAYLLPLYQWQVSTDKGLSWQDIAGANTLSYQRFPTAEGTYWYRLSVVEQSNAGIAACRIASNNVAINVHAFPAVNAGPDRFVIAGHAVILGATVSGEAPTFYWDPPDYLSDNSLINPEASPVTETVYTLFATSLYGCKNKDDVVVKVVAGIFVPNAFTPNNDGKNDTWRIPFLDPALGASVNVYNRLGQLIYHAEEKTVDWDGNVNGAPQPPGTYVYIITFKSGYAAMKGTVLIIR